MCGRDCGVDATLKKKQAEGSLVRTPPRPFYEKIGKVVEAGVGSLNRACISDRNAF
jgi:hypothetical protein